jgi:thioredoxin 1
METQTTNKSFAEAINSEKPVLVDFFAEWCGPCKMMAPILQDLKKQMGDEITILKIDVDRNPNAAATYNVQGVPTLIVFKGGEIKWRQSGVVGAKQLQSVFKSIKN